MEQVILVDERDNVLGWEEKIVAHQDGKLHRAFSVFVFDSQGRFLLQRRALDKYHSPGLWSNTCCSHPKPGESTAAGASRRLREEMGLECELGYVGAFIYRASFENGLVEHEYDHIFVGRSDVEPRHDPAEVHEWRLVTAAALMDEMARAPAAFTYWFRHCLVEPSLRRLLLGE